MCEICPTLTRKIPEQICETVFLQMCSFSIILASLYSLNLSFSYLFCVISTAILKFSPSLSASSPWFPTFLPLPPRFPTFSCWFHSLHSHPYSQHYPHFIPQFPVSVFTESLPKLESLRIYFRKIVALAEKRTLLFVTSA